MAHMWKVGDKAVCIREKPWKTIYGSNRPDQSPKFMDTLLVDGIGCDHIGPWLSFKGYPRDMYGVENFRPIVKADDDFIAQMRSLKPKVKQ